MACLNIYGSYASHLPEHTGTKTLGHQKDRFGTYIWSPNFVKISLNCRFKVTAILILHRFGLKMPIHAQKWRFCGFDPK